MDDPRRPGSLAPLLLLSGVVIAVAAGFTKGLWLDNLHNGLLAPAFAGVGAYVLHQLPKNRCGWVFLATGTVEAIMFLGRQVGHDPAPGTSPWWGWLGVWPLVVGLALVTTSVIVFPDGRLPSAAWRWVLGVGAVLTGLIALTAALWPVGYAAAGVAMPPPFTARGNGPPPELWSATTHAVFTVFQVVWLVAVANRWRRSGPTVRRQLSVVGASALVSVVALAIGLVGWGTPTPGLLAACLVPVAAGWAIVHGQSLATRSVLGWASARSEDPSALPSDLAAAIARTLDAEEVIIWARRDRQFHAVGTAPVSDAPTAPVTELDANEGPAGGTTVRRVVVRDGLAVGAVTVRRTDPLSRHDDGLLDGLCSQAALVLEHLALAATLSDHGTPERLDRLTPRENDVLALMAKGLTNAAICDELHLSIKTVEPLIGSIFSKLGLSPGSNSNRRVLAVLAHLEGKRRVGPAG